MTKITIRKQNNSIIQIESSGHSGYACEGEDIVCAAISAILQTAVRGLDEVARVKYSKQMKDGYLKVTLQKDLDEKQRHDADIILETMLIGLLDLEESFLKYVKVEVK